MPSTPAAGAQPARGQSLLRPWPPRDRGV